MIEVLRPILVRTLVVVLPSAGLLGLGRLTYACWSFFALLGVVMLYDILQHQHLYPIATVVACTPLMILLRGQFFYSGPQILYALAIVQAPMDDVARLRRNPLIVTLVAGCVLYWLASFVYTREYASNFRAVELALSASLIYLLAQHRLYCRPALLGFAVCGIAVGLGLLPNGGVDTFGQDVFRLGFARVEGRSIGNPISFGTVVGMAFLLTISSSGRWLGLAGHRLALLAVQLITALWLLLSTSRGSWAVVLIASMIIYATEPQQRAKLRRGVVWVVLLGVLLVTFLHNATLADYLDKTFSKETSMNKLTTGRNLQWASFPAAWSAAPFFGHGPGTSLTAARTYFEKNLIYHALILQIGVETGTFGLVCLFVFLYFVLKRAYRFYRVTRDPVALIGVVGYFVVGLTIPAFDAASGSLLGLGLIGSDLSRFVAVSVPLPGPGIVTLQSGESTTLS